MRGGAEGGYLCRADQSTDSGGDVNTSQILIGAAIRTGFWSRLGEKSTVYTDCKQR